MQQLAILNTRDIKRIKEQLIRQFGYAPTEEYAYLKSEKEKIFIINKDVARIELKNLIIDKMGLYFAEDKGTEIRLSKEGAQLLGREAQKNKKPLKNSVNLSIEEVQTYFQGQDLEKDLGGENRLVLLQYEKDVLGCSRYKEGKILNFLPKIHRGEVIV